MFPETSQNQRKRINNDNLRLIAYLAVNDWKYKKNSNGQSYVSLKIDRGSVEDSHEKQFVTEELKLFHGFLYNIRVREGLNFKMP